MEQALPDPGNYTMKGEMKEIFETLSNAQSYSTESVTDCIIHAIKLLTAKVEALEKRWPEEMSVRSLLKHLDKRISELEMAHFQSEVAKSYERLERETQPAPPERQELGSFYADWSKTFDVWWAKRTVPEDETPLDANVKLGWASVGFEAGAQVYATELSRLRDLVRWRDAGKEKPEKDGWYLIRFPTLDSSSAEFRGGEWNTMTRVRYWLPLPPLPKETK